ncbi:MAG: sodium:alanine symporter family protein [Acidobacteria bacterium]|nr:sodium:alanine symporter family protein [Acidobacteriota bacterium]
MVVLLLGAGIYVTFRLGFVQIRRFKHAWQVVSGRYDDPDHQGDITHFQALSAALSATVGIGNIAGVATAIHYGGPGALFWMWITAVFGMALKYAECTLSLNFRVVNADGSVSGGPMYYIERGLGKAFKPMAIFFATCAAISSFGSGNAVQAFTVADQFRSDFNIAPWITGIVLVVLVGAVILGGIKRIGKVASKLAPFMAILYVSAAFLALMLHFDKIPGMFETIFKSAFNPPAQIGGFAGATFLYTLVWGVKRGIFSNEAGQGSAPIAHAAAKTNEPAREGAVAMLGPFIDTLIVCTMTGLVIVSTGAWTVLDAGGKALNGSPMTAYAFKMALAPVFGSYGNYLVTVSVFLFAVSTAISWSYYGDRAVQYLFGDRGIKPYKFLFLVMQFAGAVFSLEIVWGFGDIALGLMAIPNLIAVILLTPKVKEITKDYFSRKHEVFK